MIIPHFSNDFVDVIRHTPFSVLEIIKLYNDIPVDDEIDIDAICNELSTEAEPPEWLIKEISKYRKET